MNHRIFAPMLCAALSAPAWGGIAASLPVNEGEIVVTDFSAFDFSTGATGDSTGADPFGFYTFRIYFVLDTTQMTDFALDIDVAVDNSANFYLNGNNIGSSPGFGSFTTLSTTNQSFFNNGLNVLEAGVFNSGSFMGLLVEGGVTYRKKVANLTTARRASRLIRGEPSIPTGS
jgi:hypothetical protein